MRALVSPDELLSRPPGEVVLIDVQWNLTSTGGPPGRELYAAAHLPGAHFLDLDTELAGPPGAGGRHPLPTATTVQAALRRCGVDDDSAVVVYDQGPSYAAARAWWVLRYFGVGDVRVLDGGLAAWHSAVGPTTDLVPAPGRGTVEARPGQQPVLDAAGAAQCAARGVLLDARAVERFAGETEPLDPVAGHVPGAVSAPTTGNAEEDGRFHPASVLRERFADLGVDGTRPVGAYCGSGVTAAHQVLALHEAGIEAALYVGSWSDWVTDPGRPVATGRD